MNTGKLNMFSGLAAIMAVLCLIGTVGVSYARYQVNKSESVFYTPRQSAQVYLGQMAMGEDGQPVFDARAEGVWETVEDRSELKFSVANGISNEEYAKQDQQVQLRLIGSLGVWDGQQTVNVTLQYPVQSGAGEAQQEEIQGIATRIPEESALYSIFGDGWMFTFLDENADELTWRLEGETLSVLQFSLVMEGIELTDPSLFQLTATGTYVPE